ncbi:putative zinc finger, CCHC-type containing protein [Tanacetum coccineum]
MERCIYTYIWDVGLGLHGLIHGPLLTNYRHRNKTLHAFFKEEGIEHQTSTPRTPEQNGVVERRNRTLVEAARTMLSALKLPLFFWAEVIATACYTQNRSIIIPTHEKMAYHIINDRKPSIKHLHIFGCTCYLTRDGENLDKMKEKGDPCILVGYSTQSKGYRVYNKRTRLIVESIHLRFDEIKEMSETSVANDTSGLVPQRQKASDYDNPDPAPELQNVSPSADTTVPSQQELDLLFGPLYDEFFNDGTSRVTKSSSPTDNSIQKDTTPSMNIQPPSEPSTPTNVHAEENNDHQAEFTNPFCTPVQEIAESSSRNIGTSNMHTFNQPQDSEYRWTKDHPLTQVRGNPSKPVQTRQKLATDRKINAEEHHHFTDYKLGNSLDKPWAKRERHGTPMAMKPKLDADLSGEPVDQTDYHSKIRSLMYLTSSRPDIVQAVCYCARYQARPTEKHLKEMPIMPGYALILANHFWRNTVPGDIASQRDCQRNKTACKCHPQRLNLWCISARLTEYQLADMFTKALPEERFQYLVRRIGMRCLTPAELEVLTNESA